MTARELIERLLQLKNLDVDVCVLIEGREFDIDVVHESTYRAEYEYHLIKLKH